MVTPRACKISMARAMSIRRLSEKFLAWTNSSRQGRSLRRWASSVRMFSFRVRRSCNVDDDSLYCVTCDASHILPLAKSLDYDRARPKLCWRGHPSQEVPMSTIQISSGDKRSRTSAPTALAALLAVGMAAVVTAAPAVAQEKMTTPTPAEKKPNILFIMGDDIGWMQPSIYHRGPDGRGNAQHRPHRQ